LNAAKPPAAELRALEEGRWAVGGDLLFGNAAVLLERGEAAFGHAARAVIDLSEVRRVDSAGLAVLREWSVAARAGGRALVFRNAPPVLGALAGISDVTELLEGLAG
jgi:phospholipid transport system transporter-binding protein